MRFRIVKYVIRDHGLSLEYVPLKRVSGLITINRTELVYDFTDR